ncbi:unnamed protein product [Bursaphelenchus okinawaensis]|uniref:Centrosomal protein CEP104 Zn finger domain-containing protein n=1 Tax=Bursaphelenchus okinawaensis TaxID=465554 RepID=A0A811KLV5_9BILA|nr:unnamed protein product [Bursaphelenchus okinawaensis]CAG9104904.1 unnamed protein product [Bursaphelenchus okinawaensis]
MSRRRATSSYSLPPISRNGLSASFRYNDQNPLTSIRALQSDLNRVERRSNDVNKSQLASEAKLILERAEREINKIQKRRTEALLQGDTINSDRLSRLMQRIYADAVRSARVERVLDEPSRRLQSYDRYDSRLPAATDRFRRRPRVVTPPPDYYREYVNDRTAPPSSYTNFRSPWRLSSPPENREERGFRRARNKSRRRARTTERLQYTSNSEAEIKNIRRNKRLKDVKLPKTADVIKEIPVTGQSQLYPVPDPGETNLCPQCYERNDAFATEANLKQHWLYQCPVLTECDFCDQVLHVAELNNHHINLCQFVNKTMLPCPLCGLAQYGGESNHPRCPKAHPEPGAAWCPLCSKNVESFTSPESWRNHLIGNCLNNPRIRSRWNGKTAPTQGAALLTGLNLDPSSNIPAVPINPAPVPTTLATVPGTVPVNGPSFPPLSTNPGQFGALTTLNATQGLTQNQQETSPVNGQNLRSAYRRLQEERKQDYEKQQEREAAEEEVKEEEDH